MQLIKHLFGKKKVYFFCLVMVVASHSLGMATEYYVSTSGSSPWAACTNISTPCSLETARSNAVAGDTVYLRGGTYELPSVSVGPTDYWAIAFLPAQSGSIGNPITFQAYREEDVFFDNSANIGKANPVAAYGTHFVDYVVFDGIDTKCALAGGAGDDGHCKAVIIHQTTGTVVKNADIEGVITDGNNASIRIEKATDCVIENNLLHGSHYASGYHHNATAIMMYHTTNTIVQNNTIYDVDCGIFDKSDGNSNHHRLNYIHSCPLGINLGVKHTFNSGTMVYQNVFRNITEFWAFDVSDADSSGFPGLKLYNNTFYNVASGIRLRDSSRMTQAEVFNNIIHTHTAGITIVSHNGATDYLDHNIYYSTNDFRYNDFRYNGLWDGVNYSTLSSWQSASGWDANANTNNPNFVNPGGTSPEDYKRTSYPADGRGGSYPSVRGAYITDNEVIGYSSEPPPPPPPPPPSTPSTPSSGIGEPQDFQREPSQ